MNHFAFLVNHIHAELFLRSRDDRETVIGTAEHGALDGLHRTGERCRCVDHIVDVVAFHLDVLEVVDMSAGIYSHVLVALQNREHTSLHVCALAFSFVGVCIDGMVSHNDYPVLLGILQRVVEPV